ncbi:uncharacterized protein CMU_039170 [Cryptosporidium muris RN66]|uniref:RanBP2-type domain-containing protein n=1 Tax=Cryptosporidium muris (strain RN66) TaxID=441375 RepID=B6A9F9_CRYMR|nr:uncharacterized protein CMU_039170 [Cryptosporidium muris RN66]EEA04850.1 hypothetical protein, conserved [Cryptosporidium muris RN66]|eukprot:XP_002139199.1 hypothetical protein [Cryptosporidium muris RN66]
MLFTTPKPRPQYSHPSIIGLDCDLNESKIEYNNNSEYFGELACMIENSNLDTPQNNNHINQSGANKNCTRLEQNIAMGMNIFSSPKSLGCTVSSTRSTVASYTPNVDETSPSCVLPAPPNSDPFILNGFGVDSNSGDINNDFNIPLLNYLSEALTSNSWECFLPSSKLTDYCPEDVNTVTEKYSGESNHNNNLNSLTMIKAKDLTDKLVIDLVKENQSLNVIEAATEILQCALANLGIKYNKDSLTSGNWSPNTLGVGGPNFAAPTMLAHPDEFKNPSSFLKIYGDPLCGKTPSNTHQTQVLNQNNSSTFSGVNPMKGQNGNWACVKCSNVNFPRRFRCFKCGEYRDETGDRIVADYAKQVYLHHLKAYRSLSYSNNTNVSSNVTQGSTNGTNLPTTNLNNTGNINNIPSWAPNQAFLNEYQTPMLLQRFNSSPANSSCMSGCNNSGTTNNISRQNNLFSCNSHKKNVKHFIKSSQNNPNGVAS